MSDLPATRPPPTTTGPREPSARSARACDGAHGRRGFTLVEIAVAIAIVGVLAAIALRTYDSYRERALVTDAASGITVTSALIDQFRSEHGSLPDTLADVGAGSLRDPWGNPYQYVSHADTKSKGQWRKDHNIVPINSDYDLWSLGKDGKSSPPLTAAPSRDDVVRANNGRFVGLASQYNP
jgi:general secretion pathway protein G